MARATLEERIAKAEIKLRQLIARKQKNEARMTGGAVRLRVFGQPQPRKKFTPWE